MPHAENRGLLPLRHGQTVLLGSGYSCDCLILLPATWHCLSRQATRALIRGTRLVSGSRRKYQNCTKHSCGMRVQACLSFIHQASSYTCARPHRAPQRPWPTRSPWAASPARRRLADLSPSSLDQDQMRATLVWVACETSARLKGVPASGVVEPWPTSNTPSPGRRLASRLGPRSKLPVLGPCASGISAFAGGTKASASFCAPPETSMVESGSPPLKERVRGSSREMTLPLVGALSCSGCVAASVSSTVWPWPVRVHANGRPAEIGRASWSERGHDVG